MKTFCPFGDHLCPENERCGVYEIAANKCGLAIAYKAQSTAAATQDVEFALKDITETLNRIQDELVRRSSWIEERAKRHRKRRMARRRAATGAPANDAGIEANHNT